MITLPSAARWENRQLCLWAAAFEVHTLPFLLGSSEWQREKERAILVFNASAASEPSESCPDSSSLQLALVSPNGEQYDSLLRQLRDRMDEGSGETIYVVGMGSGK